MRKLVYALILCSLGGWSCYPSTVSEPVETARPAQSVTPEMQVDPVMPVAAADLAQNHAAASRTRRSPVSSFSAPCKGSVSDYCKRLQSGKCPTFEQSLAQRAGLCSHPPWNVVKHQCKGVYRSVSWHDPQLGGGEEFFNASGILIAAKLATDYNAYCEKTSFGETFGDVPVCKETPESTRICK